MLVQQKTRFLAEKGS